MKPETLEEASGSSSLSVSNLFFSSYFVFLLFLLSEFNNGSTDYAEKLQKNVQLPDLDEEPCLWWSRIEKNQDSRNSHLENKGILAKLYMVTAVNHLKTTREAVCFVCFHRCLNFLLLLFFLFFSLMHLNINCSVCEVTLILDHSELSSNTADEIRFFIFSSPFSFFVLWFHLFHLLPMHAILMPSDILWGARVVFSSLATVFSMPFTQPIKEVHFIYTPPPPPFCLLFHPSSFLYTCHHF